MLSEFRQATFGPGPKAQSPCGAETNTTPFLLRGERQFPALTTLASWGTPVPRSHQLASWGTPVPRSHQLASRGTPVPRSHHSCFAGNASSPLAVCRCGFDNPLEAKMRRSLWEETPVPRLPFADADLTIRSKQNCTARFAGGTPVPRLPFADADLTIGSKQNYAARFAGNASSPLAVCRRGFDNRLEAKLRRSLCGERQFPAPTTLASRGTPVPRLPFADADLTIRSKQKCALTL